MSSHMLCRQCASFAVVGVTVVMCQVQRSARVMCIKCVTQRETRMFGCTPLELINTRVPRLDYVWRRYAVCRRLHTHTP